MKATNHVFPSRINNTVFQGLWVRDYVAIQAMASLCANPNLNDLSPDQIADIAYKQADAMIERSKIDE